MEWATAGDMNSKMILTKCLLTRFIFSEGQSNGRGLPKQACLRPRECAALTVIGGWRRNEKILEVNRRARCHCVRGGENCTVGVLDSDS